MNLKETRSLESAGNHMMFPVSTLKSQIYKGRTLTRVVETVVELKYPIPILPKYGNRKELHLFILPLCDYKTQTISIQTLTKEWSSLIHFCLPTFYILPARLK